MRHKRVCLRKHSEKHRASGCVSFDFETHVLYDARCKTPSIYPILGLLILKKCIFRAWDTKRCLIRHACCQNECSRLPRGKNSKSALLETCSGKQYEIVAILARESHKFVYIFGVLDRGVKFGCDSQKYRETKTTILNRQKTTEDGLIENNKVQKGIL